MLIIPPIQITDQTIINTIEGSSTSIIHEIAEIYREMGSTPLNGIDISEDSIEEIPDKSLNVDLMFNVLFHIDKDKQGKVLQHITDKLTITGF